MQVVSIAVYSHTGEIQHWDFRLGAVNIVTGSRRTGKTALLQIVEYCLGKGECEIPLGVIRDSVEWYGLLMQAGDTQIFIARRNPKTESTSSEIFVDIGASLVLPQMDRLHRTTDPDGLTSTLGDILGIGENLFTPPEGTSRLPLEANFKHCWPYLFQRQDEVASPSFLFHREKENSFMQQAIKDTLPYFLGVVKENRLLKQEELRRLRAEALRLRRRIQESEWLRNEALARGKALIAAAQELGIYTNSVIPEAQDIVVRILKQIAAWEGDATENAPGLALDRLQEERTELLTRYRKLNTTLEAMTNFAGTQSLFENEITEQKVRLQSIGLLKKSDDEVHCPLCDSAISKLVPTTAQIISALDEVSVQLESVSRERSRLDRLISERSSDLSLLRQQLRDKGSQIDAALAQNATMLERRQLDNRRSHAIGRVSLYLEGLEVREEQNELKVIHEDYLERIRALEEDLDDDQFDLELSSIANLVSQPLTRWSADLDVEYAGRLHRFDPRRLTIVADTQSGAITMGKMGGGTNALGNHLLALFGLHSWFALNSRPVPRFLMLDQISQVYYPADLQADPNEDDRLRVLQMYEWLFSRVAELEGSFQLIVTDHADINEPWFREAIVARWRNGVRMIPSSWQQ